MKTIKEWSRLCSDETIRQQWIDNANAQDWYYWENNDVCESMDCALFYAFDWSKSPQKHDYWERIREDIS